MPSRLILQWGIRPRLTLTGSGLIHRALRLFRQARLNMRVLLRKRRTNLYYVGAGDHTGIHDLAAGHQQALDFGSVPRAAKFALEQHLANVAIILRYDWYDVELALPVLPEWCLLDEVALRPLGEPISAGAIVLF